MNHGNAPKPVSGSVSVCASEQPVLQPRDSFLDGMRGLLLMIMFLNHLWVLLPEKFPVFNWINEFIAQPSHKEKSLTVSLRFPKEYRSSSEIVI